MKVNKWTLALATAGVVSLGSVVQAEEAPHQVLTALSSTTLSGYIDASAEWRPGGNAGSLPGRSFDGPDKMDGFNLNVVGLTLEKPLDEGQWAAGYKVDLVFGPNANYYGTLLNGGAIEPGGANDFNVKQAYVAVRAPVGNGLDIKMGAFDTVVGYEVFESGNNPNYSRSFGYFIEPAQHTGVLAAYHVNDLISVAGGVANTAFGPINGKTAISSQKTYLGAVTLTLPEATGPVAGSAVYAGVVDGRGLGNTVDTTSWYAGTTLKTPVEGLAVGGAFDYRQSAPPLGLFGSTTDNWAWAAAVYASYQATEKLRLNARGDWANGSDGTFYDRGANGIAMHDNELVGMTLTADYALWNGLITRLEGRWDHALNGDKAFTSGTTGLPAYNNAFTVALNMVYKF